MSISPNIEFSYNVPMLMEISYDDSEDALYNELYNASFQGKWKHVSDLYERNSLARTANFRSANGNTALHLAVLEAEVEDVKTLMNIIRPEELPKIKNYNGETPLHLAASRGLLDKCKCIAPKAHSWLSSRNNDTETPLFSAALHGHEYVFLYLNSVSDALGLKGLCRRTTDGNTVLHVTIEREYFGLAYSIIHIHGDLLVMRNSDGVSPLQFLANKPSAFRSSTHLQCWKSIIYHTITIDPMMFVPKTKFEDPQATNAKTLNLPPNYTTWHDFFVMMENILTKAFKQDQQPQAENPDLEGLEDALRSKYTFPRNYATSLDFLSGSFMYILGQSGFGDEFRRIRSKKERHMWSFLIMEKLVEPNVMSSMTGDGGQPVSLVSQPGDHQVETRDSGESFSMIPKPTSETKREEKKEEHPSTSTKTTWDTPLLIAARNGVSELIEKILKVTPVAVHDLTADKKNVLLVAVENRHPQIFRTILERGKLFNHLIQTVDINGNTVLHYAAMSSGRQPWRIPGAALQMQWEIKWYEFVKDKVPVHFVFRANKLGKSPATIFNDDHKDLVTDGGKWLKSTANSCSVVAALIATVAFATAVQVPGGNKENGAPNLEGQPAFNLFAIASLVSLCFSVTALIMFLAILTSRYQTRDFRRDLPVKLFLGLSSLLVSIASVLVSFCAGHFFEVKDRFGHSVFPIYFVTCLPITFYAVAQCPLYIDLWKAIHIDIPQPSRAVEDF